MSQLWWILTWLFFAQLVLAAYIAPSIVALARSVNFGPVLVLNLFLGWTFVGWVVALAFAVASRPKPVVIFRPLNHSIAA